MAVIGTGFVLASMIIDAKLQPACSQAREIRGERGMNTQKNDIPSPRKAVERGINTAWTSRPHTTQQRCTKVMSHVILLKARRTRDAKITASVSLVVMFIPNERYSEHAVNMR